MKIALVNDTVYPFSKGGAQKRVFEIGRRLAKNNKVVWYGLNHWRGKSVVELGNMKIVGVCPEYPLYESGRRTIKEAVLFSIYLFISLMRGRFDTAYCTNLPFFPVFATRLACLIKHKPMVLDVLEVWDMAYWREYLGWRGIIGFWIEWLAVRMTKNVIADGRHVADRLQTVLGVKAKEIAPDGINWERIQGIEPSKEHYDIVYCGRLLPHKNVGLLIDALKTLREQGKMVTCCIIGEGFERMRLQGMADGLGIVFKGRIESDDEVISIMKSAHCFAHPSLREGCGCTMPEANACGLMIVGVDDNNNSSREYIANNDTGYLAQNKAEDFADGLLIGVRNHPTVKNRCIEISKQYDWDNTAEIFRRMLE